MINLSENSKHDLSIIKSSKERLNDVDCLIKAGELDKANKLLTLHEADIRKSLSNNKEELSEISQLFEKTNKSMDSLSRHIEDFTEKGRIYNSGILKIFGWFLKKNPYQTLFVFFGNLFITIFSFYYLLPKFNIVVDKGVLNVLVIIILASFIPLYFITIHLIKKIRKLISASLLDNLYYRAMGVISLDIVISMLEDEVSVKKSLESILDTIVSTRKSFNYVSVTGGSNDK